MENIQNCFSPDNIYPKSILNNQCIGPCYKENTLITHPKFLSTITNKNNFCPIDNVYKLIDLCDKSTKSYEDASNILITQVNFDTLDFLKFYNFKVSLNNIYVILKNNEHLNNYSKIRIIDCFLDFFYNKNKSLKLLFKILIDEKLINYYIFFIVDDYIDDLYYKLQNYIYIDNNNDIFLKKNQQNSDPKNIILMKDMKEKFLIDKFINTKKIYNYLSKYSKKDLQIYLKNPSKYKNSYIYFIIFNYFIFLEKKIIKTLS